MNVRPFDWRDLPTLHRCRNQGLFLDSALLLTRRPSLIPTGALLNYFAPTTGIYTFVGDGDGSANGSILGQVTYSAGSQVAHLSFLAPEEAFLSPEAEVEPLIERMSIEVAERGGMFIVAETYESHPAFDLLRRAGFAVYTRQRFWQLNVPPAVAAPESAWRPFQDRDLIPVRSLYNNLVPGLIQQVQPPPSGKLKGLVCYQGDDLLGFIELQHGPRGILAQPFIHPNAESLPASMLPLLESLPERGARGMYLCVRSYQSWLETALYDAEAQPSPLNALMVKRLVVSRRAEQPVAIPALDGTRIEPIARIERKEPSGSAPTKNGT
ncbi:MAG: hypothetical protein ACOYYS_23740 [Chloroflexota bacterium]